MIHYAKGKLSTSGVTFDVSSPAFRYGAGFFETVCYNGSEICHLDLHLDRLLHSLRALQIEHTTVDFEGVIDALLTKNDLEGEFCRVNIFYPMDEGKSRPVVTVAPFERKPYKAYRLCLCDDRHVSALNAMKTTSYMFFHLALKQARARGFDDAVLMDFDNNLLETTTGALLFKKGGDYFELDTPYKLPSTALKVATDVLDITTASINVDDLGEFRQAYILNSLIGMRPIVTIGETAFVPDETPCAKVTKAVIGIE